MGIVDRILAFLAEDEVSLPPEVPAIVAACALMAHADGTASEAERQTIGEAAMHALSSRPATVDEVRRLMDLHNLNFARGSDFGRAHALAVLEDWTTGTPDQKNRVMRAALEVGRSDPGGDLNGHEVRAAREIAGTLGVDPARFDL